MPNEVESSRRTFLSLLAGGAGALLVGPTSTGCVPASNAASPPAAPDPLAVPKARPEAWDAITFNRARGNAGAIPASYRPQINGPNGATDHLGKHLPYVASLPAGSIPAGRLALMWGDPARGYAKHPNAEPSPSNPEGHWYDWVRVRKAVPGDAIETESRFSSWPHGGAKDSGAFRAATGADPAADAGRNTVYVVELPPDVRPGDLVRVHAHCLTHGEYVDFLVVPG